MARVEYYMNKLLEIKRELDKTVAALKEQGLIDLEYTDLVDVETTESKRKYVYKIWIRN